ncbi:DUF7660 family protein [Bacillus cihuensis]|uniref:DUF7660 family protein n=1 Tax=Bacillus cihuensis TaxID=1208599 RepID=UPI0004165722|nr:hypothetical protein [Bacillus cihuensis]
MKNSKELKAFAIGDDFKLKIVQVVISHSKDIAVFWLRDVEGYTNEEIAKFKVCEFPLDKKVYIKDYGETTARELMKEIGEYPAFVFSKENDNDYYENWLSDLEKDEMDIWDKCNYVRTKDDLISFINLLRTDLKTNEEEWENTTLEAYLESIEAWMTNANKLSDKPNWKDFAQILVSGRFYE